MGETAENLVDMYDITREEQDDFALESQEKARDGKERRAAEIVTVEVPGPKGSTRTVIEDEHPRPDTTLEALERLEPVFREGGSVTAGNSAGITDGAAAMVLMSESRATSEGREPLARILGMSWAGVPPEIMGIGPVPATKMVLERTGLSLADIDLIEINEAFAAQVIACERELKIDRDRLNVNGGGISIGHPIGMSGARIILSLAYEMRARGVALGLGDALHLGRPGPGRRPRAPLKGAPTDMSVHAVVLIQCEIDGIPEAAQAIADIDGVSEVYSVAGEFDLVAIVRVSQHDDLANGDPRRDRQGRRGRPNRDPDRVPGLLQARPGAAVLDRVRGRLVWLRLPCRRAHPTATAATCAPTRRARPSSAAGTSPRAAGGRARPRPRPVTMRATAARRLVPDPDRHVGVRAQVLHPVAAIAAAGEHVDATPSCEREPDLDLVRFAAHATGGGQVAVVEGAEVPVRLRRQRTAQIDQRQRPRRWRRRASRCRPS